MLTYPEHVEIMKVQDTTKFDISFDSPLKKKCTLKISTFYLLPSPRKPQKSK